MKYSEFVKRKMSKMDMNIQQLAKKTNLSAGFLSDVLRNNRYPSYDNYMKIMEALYFDYRGKEIGFNMIAAQAQRVPMDIEKLIIEIGLINGFDNIRNWLNREYYARDIKGGNNV